VGLVHSPLQRVMNAMLRLKITPNAPANAVLGEIDRARAG